MGGSGTRTRDHSATLPPAYLTFHEAHVTKMKFSRGTAFTCLDKQRMFKKVFFDFKCDEGLKLSLYM